MLSKLRGVPQGVAFPPAGPSLTPHASAWPLRGAQRAGWGARGVRASPVFADGEEREGGLGSVRSAAEGAGDPSAVRISRVTHLSKLWPN